METAVFVSVVVLVIIVMIVIIIRMWYILKPYIDLIMAAIKIANIIKTFTKDIILSIANYIKEVKSELYALFKFGNLDLVVMNNFVNCGNHLDACIEEKVKELERLGNKFIIASFGKGTYSAIRLANLLSERGKEVYLLLIEPLYLDGMEKVLPNKEVNTINVVPEGEKAIVEGIDLFVSNPLTRSDRKEQLWN